MSGYNFQILDICIFCPQIFFTIINRVDLDKMPHYGTSSWCCPGILISILSPFVESANRKGKILKPLANHYTSYTTYLVFSHTIWCALVCVCFIMFDWIIYVLVNNFSVVSGVGTGLPGLKPVLSRG